MMTPFGIHESVERKVISKSRFVLYFAWNVKLWNDTFIFFSNPYPFQLLKYKKKI
jgi:hypothetical protein